jgi:hypothetical protein
MAISTAAVVACKEIGLGFAETPSNSEGRERLS